MKKTRFVPLIVYLLLLSLAFSFVLRIFSTPSNAIPYSGIVSMIESGKVKNFVVEDQTITMELHEALDGKTVVTLPEDLSALPACKLVRVDVTPATADAARTEALVDVPFRMSNGQLTFTAEVGGLYLLISAE